MVSTILMMWERLVFGLPKKSIRLMSLSELSVQEVTMMMARASCILMMFMFTNIATAIGIKNLLLRLQIDRISCDFQLNWRAGDSLRIDLILKNWAEPICWNSALPNRRDSFLKTQLKCGRDPGDRISTLH